MRFELFLLNIKEIKGISHPKMKLMSLITHPHVIPNPSDLVRFIFGTQINMFLMKSEIFLILHRQHVSYHDQGSEM